MASRFFVSPLCLVIVLKMLDRNFTVYIKNVIVFDKLSYIYLIVVATQYINILSFIKNERLAQVDSNETGYVSCHTMSMHVKVIAVPRVIHKYIFKNIIFSLYISIFSYIKLSFLFERLTASVRKTLIEFFFFLRNNIVINIL